MGYLGSAAALLAIVSGLVLTVQALIRPRISYGWDLVHVVSTFAVMAFAGPHVLVVLFRDMSTAS